MAHSKQWVIRAKPKKVDLADCTLVDMHFHSKYSKDGTRSIPVIIKRCQKLGMGVAITDHNTIRGSLEALRHKSDVLVIPAAELTSVEGVHILAYAYSEKDLLDVNKKCIQPFLQKNPSVLRVPLDTLLTKLQKINCLVGAAHPYFGFVGIRTSKANHHKYIKKIDCVEVLNRYSLKRYNAKAYRWALEEKKGLTGGSDGHLLHNLGKVVTGVEGRKTVKSFLEAIQHRKSFVIGTECNWLDRAWNTIWKEARILTSGKGLRIARGQAKLGYSYCRDRLNGWRHTKHRC